MASVTKKDLVNSIAGQLADKGSDITRELVAGIVQTMIDEIAERLARGDTVVMRNFGAFQAREVKAKIGRNPKDPAKPVPIPARATVKFKAGKELKERVAALKRVHRKRKTPPPG